MGLGWRWLLVIARVLAWVLVFAAIVIPHLLLTLFGRRDIVPPRFLGALAWIAGVRIRVKGRPQRHALLLANHISWIDILALAGVSRTAFVAHSGLADNAALAWLCRQNGTVFITRDKRQSVAEQVGQVQDRLGHGRLTIFPEATTSDGTRLLPFRSSLLSAVERLPRDVVVQPVALEYENAPGMCWVGDEPGLENFARIMGRMRAIELTIHFLAPLTSEAMENRKIMAAVAQREIADVLPIGGEEEMDRTMP
ncbi:lysophospholipid acyltransferase family protein [Alteraurantiacibacter aquimixticola]|uniref:lysophospholipid acyltransferase family protein n=1 Tax=Alteraurantiacibacter aquimixticola TaxID=2489173 RepID=UPI00145B88F5|nr:lysophospholipid acyltransferase family protein [Alteraurantiacibacter aquimixticola]